MAWLVTGGSLLGYTGFIYLIEHVPVAKVTSYAYVNPVVAVLLGIFILHERPEAAEFIGMAAVVFAVFLLTTAQVGAKHQRPREIERSIPISGRWLLVESRGRNKLRKEVSIQCDGGSFKFLQRLIIAGHGHPANGRLLQQAARNLEGIRHLGMTFRIAFRPFDPHVVASHGIGAIHRIAKVEDCSRSLGTSFGESGKILLSHDLPEAIEGQRHCRQKRRRSSRSCADRNLNAGDLSLFFVGLGLLGLLLLHFRKRRLRIGRLPSRRDVICEAEFLR